MTTSPNDTTVPGSASITDANGNVWTLNESTGLIYKNGVADTTSSGVTLLLFYGGALYKETANGYFYENVTGSWYAVSADPRLSGGVQGPQGPAGPNGNTILTTSGTPASSVGVNGDFAYDPTAEMMYGPKANGAWPAGHSLLASAPAMTLAQWQAMAVASGLTISTTPTVSASGTTIPSATSIIDSTDVVWTLVSGQCARNGVVDTSTSGVTLILYFGGVVYRENTAGSFYKWVNSAWTQTTDPRVSAELPGFYGVNSHFDMQIPSTGGATQAGTIANTIAMMKTLGMKTLRITWEGQTTPNNGFGLTTLQSLVQYAQAFQADGTGLKLYVCIDLMMDSGVGNGSGSSGIAYTSEAAAYSATYAYGSQIATALAPYAANILAFECGNEMDSRTSGGVSVRIPATPTWVAGTYAHDYNQSVWPILRGCVGGCMAGIRSVTTAIPCASNAFINSSIVASDMLWNGTNPDGTTGSATVRWDITAWHIYTPNGLNVSNDDGVQFNLFAYLKTAYGKPIVVSEWGYGNTDTADTTSNLSAWYAARLTYNIISVHFFSLFDGGFNCMTTTTTAPYGVPNAVGTALQTFIAANPA